MLGYRRSIDLPIFGQANSSKFSMSDKRPFHEKLCPRCWHFMDWAELSNKQKKWALFTHAWICIRCPEVTFHEGKINLEENSLPIIEKKRLFKALKYFYNLAKIIEN